MTKVEKLENEIKELSLKEMAVLRDWFIEYDSTVWDEQIKNDIESGKLTNLSEKALKEHKTGNTREI